MSGLLQPDQLLVMLEGNRRLTIRTVAAFPEESLFTYSPKEPLRPFADMVKEILEVEVAYVRGAATSRWSFESLFAEVKSKAALLEACEQVRAQTLELWPQLTVERLLHEEADNLFGPGVQSNLSRLIYALENEIHHRGQGFTYLRMLGIEPPAFYER